MSEAIEGEFARGIAASHGRDPVESNVRTEVPSVFDTAGAARYLGISDALLEHYRVRGGGPRFVKLNRLVRYRRAALDEWLLSRERRTTSDVSGDAE